MSLLKEYKGAIPAPGKLFMSRGSTFQYKFFQVSEIVDPDASPLVYEPVDIRGYDYLFEIRRHKLEPDTCEPLLSAGSAYFHFGQSDEALQYDIDEGNPAGSTFDELFIEIPETMTKIQAGTWWWGLRSKQHVTGIVELIQQDQIIVDGDVPRFITEV